MNSAAADSLFLLFHSACIPSCSSGPGPAQERRHDQTVGSSTGPGGGGSPAGQLLPSGPGEAGGRGKDSEEQTQRTPGLGIRKLDSSGTSAASQLGSSKSLFFPWALLSSPGKWRHRTFPWCYCKDLVRKLKTNIGRCLAGKFPQLTSSRD